MLFQQLTVRNQRLICIEKISTHSVIRVTSYLVGRWLAAPSLRTPLCSQPLSPAGLDLSPYFLMWIYAHDRMSAIFVGSGRWLSLAAASGDCVIETTRICKASQVEQHRVLWRGRLSERLAAERLEAHHELVVLQRCSVDNACTAGYDSGTVLRCIKIDTTLQRKLSYVAPVETINSRWQN